MERQDSILELKDLFSRLWEDLNAIELMVLGLAQARDPYAKGFGAICTCFRENMTEIQELLEKLKQ